MWRRKSGMNTISPYGYFPFINTNGAIQMLDHHPLADHTNMIGTLFWSHLQSFLSVREDVYCDKVEAQKRLVKNGPRWHPEPQKGCTMSSTASLRLERTRDTITARLCLHSEQRWAWKTVDFVIQAFWYSWGGWSWNRSLWWRYTTCISW